MTSIVSSATRDDATADTGDWVFDNDGLPTSASTRFFSPWVESADPDRTSHHELLHGLGFSFQAALFKKHVDDALNFREKSDATGKVLGILARLGGTHLDDEKRDVNGFDQSDSVMSPYFIVRQRMGAQEKQILDAAFGWSRLNANLTAQFDTAFNDAQKKSVQSALNAAAKLFASNRRGHAFVWKVSASSGALALDQLANPA